MLTLTTTLQINVKLVTFLSTLGKVTLAKFPTLGLNKTRNLRLM